MCTNMLNSMMPAVVMYFLDRQFGNSALAVEYHRMFALKKQCRLLKSSLKPKESVAIQKIECGNILSFLSRGSPLWSQETVSLNSVDWDILRRKFRALFSCAAKFQPTFRLINLFSTRFARNSVLIVPRIPGQFENLFWSTNGFLLVLSSTWVAYV